MARRRGEVDDRACHLNVIPSKRPISLDSADAVTIPATTCTQLQAGACIRMRGLEPDCADRAQYSKVPL
jgi:hypothetical protein